MNLLDQLKQMTKVVADTGDFNSMKKFRPLDATTNPSLILAASKDASYKHLIEEAVVYGKEKGTGKENQMTIAMDKVAVNFGREILKIVPGRVSTEVDAKLSFDTNATIEKAKEIIGLYEEAGISRQKILIKIASTWEGIQAGRTLEKEGIHCNLTLLFSLTQAIACAEAGIQLISPFVGRILDWHKKNKGVDNIPAWEDPGVASVKSVFQYYKKFDYHTEIMGASFRSAEEIIELAGCDLLTISPSLLHELENREGKLIQKLNSEDAQSANIIWKKLDEKSFRWDLNENAMATEKLAEGIRRFNDDLMKLEKMIVELL